MVVLDRFYCTIRVSNCLDPDHDQHFVGPNSGPEVLQRLSEDYKSFQNTCRNNTLTCANPEGGGGPWHFAGGQMMARI